MDVILLEKVHNLGNLGARVKVRSGYGRNFLIPKGMAVSATPANIAKFEALRAELEKAAAEKLAQAQQRAAAINGMSVTIAHNAGDEGKLFGSIGTGDIARALTEAGASAVVKSEVRLPEGPIRQIGSFEIELDLGSDVVGTVTVNVVAE